MPICNQPARAAAAAHQRSLFGHIATIQLQQLLSHRQCVALPSNLIALDGDAAARLSATSTRAEDLCLTAKTSLLIKIDGFN